MHWYERAQPTTCKLLPSVKQSISSISAMQGVEKVGLWGSFADNIKKANAPVREVDLLVFCNFNSGDLLAIDKGPSGPFRIRPEELEDEGFNPLAVSFTKKLICSSKEIPIEYWAMSTDSKLLHWGPVADTVEEWKDIRKEADEKAEKYTGVSKNHLYKASPSKISSWFETYERSIKSAAAIGPMGWYPSSSDYEEIVDNMIII